MTGRERVEGALRKAREAGRLGFVPFVTAGDPDLGATREVVSLLGECGADVIELGIPWSDPLADGPVIQRSSERALASGTTLARVLGAFPAIRDAAGVPVILFTYFNPVLRFGMEAFVKAAADAGADGALVTDLPPDEGEPLRVELDRRGLACILLAAPTSTDARLSAIARASSGFVYAVSRTGVTGVREGPAREARELVVRLRPHTELPIAVGFGISKPEHVEALRGVADAFVVGSAIVDLIGRLGAGSEGRTTIASLCRTLVAAGCRS